MAGFPFVDAGECTRIVAGDKDHPAPRPRPGQVEEKIRGDVDAVLLHDAHRPEAGKGGRRRDFQSHLFVGGPFHVESPLLCRPGKGFDDLGRRGARIAGSDPHAGLQGAAGNGLVPHEQDLGPFFIFLVDRHPLLRCLLNRSRRMAGSLPSSSCSVRRP